MYRLTVWELCVRKKKKMSRKLRVTQPKRGEGSHWWWTARARRTDDKKTQTLWRSRWRPHIRMVEWCCGF